MQKKNKTKLQKLYTSNKQQIMVMPLSYGIITSPAYGVELVGQLDLDLVMW